MTSGDAIKEKLTALKFHRSLIAVRKMGKFFANAYPSILLNGVPKLWRELPSYYRHREIILNREQAGFGIGVLTYSASAPSI